MTSRVDVGKRVAGQKAVMADEFVTRGQIIGDLPIQVLKNGLDYDNPNDPNIYVSMRLGDGIAYDETGNVYVRLDTLQNLLEFNNGKLRLRLPNNPNVFLNGVGQWQEPPSVQGDDKHYVHSQIASMSVWTINHNLNKHPAVTVVDTGDNIIICDVEYVSNSQVKLYFNYEVSGKAYLN